MKQQKKVILPILLLIGAGTGYRKKLENFKSIDVLKIFFDKLFTTQIIKEIVKYASSKSILFVFSVEDLYKYFWHSNSFWVLSSILQKNVLGIYIFILSEESDSSKFIDFCILTIMLCMTTESTKFTILDYLNEFQYYIQLQGSLLHGQNNGQIVVNI